MAWLDWVVIASIVLLAGWQPRSQCRCDYPRQTSKKSVLRASSTISASSMCLRRFERVLWL